MVLRKLILLMSLMLLASCASRQKIAFELDGVSYDIECLTSENPKKLASGLQQQVADLHAFLNDYKESTPAFQLSEKGAQGKPVKVSAEMMQLLQFCGKINKESAGAFDPTVGPLIRLWKMADYAKSEPVPKRLVRSRSRCGWDKVSLNSETSEVTFAQKFMKISFGGFNQGYFADQLTAWLQKQGARDISVDVSGDIFLEARKDGEKWPVRVDAGAGIPKYEFLLEQGGVTTSAATNQFYTINNRRYSHAIDPRSGWPVAKQLVVTVIAKDTLTADAWATALSVLGVDGLKLIEAQPGVDAFVLRSEWGKWVAHVSSGFPELNELPSQAVAE